MKATADLQERLSAERQFMNNALNAICVQEKHYTAYLLRGAFDEELISFLEEVIVKLTSIGNLTGKPESLQEQAEQAEKALKSTNEFINKCNRVSAGSKSQSESLNTRISSLTYLMLFDEKLNSFLRKLIISAGNEYFEISSIE